MDSSTCVQATENSEDSLKKNECLHKKPGRLPNLCQSLLLFVSKKYLSFNHESNSPLKMPPWIPQWSDKSEPKKKKAASPCHSINPMVLVGGPGDLVPFPSTTFTRSSQRISAHLKARFLHNFRQLMTRQVTQLKISWLYRRHRYFPFTILHASTHRSSMPLLAMLLVVTRARPAGGDRGSEWIQNSNANETENFSNRWLPALPFQKEKS